MAINFEETLADVGELGFYQKVLYVALWFYPTYFGMHTALINYIGPPQEHWCRVEELQNISSEQQKYISVPYHDGNSLTKYDSCKVFDLPWTNYTDDDYFEWNRTLQTADADTVQCKEWNFERDVYRHTITSEWSLVCGDAWFRDFVSTLFVAGIFVGSLISGYSSDRFGRKTTLTVAVALHVVCMLSAALAPNIAIFATFRFLAGLTVRTANLSNFTIVGELLSSRYRYMMGVFSQAANSLGVLSMAGFGFAFKHFRHLHFFMASLEALTLTYWFFIPESPRWLISKGRLPEAKAIFRRIAHINGKVIPLNIRDTQECPSIKETAPPISEPRVAYLELYRHRNLRRTTLILHFAWVAVNFVHLALTLNLTGLTGDPYINVLLSGATEIPACFLCFFAVQYLGRRPSVSGCMLIAGVCSCLSIPFDLFPDLSVVATVFIIISRAVLGGGMVSLKIMTSELLPTVLRGRGQGTCLALASGVGISAPYVGGSLKNIWRPMPSLIFGLLGLVGGVMVLWLPETLNQVMPDTVLEANNLGSYSQSHAHQKKNVPSSTDAKESPSNSVSTLPQEGNGVSPDTVH